MHYCLARAFSTMVIKSCESRHSFLVPDLRRKASSFIIKYDTCMFFIEAPDQIEEVLYSYFSEHFYHVLNFMKYFLCINLYNHVIFSFLAY